MIVACGSVCFLHMDLALLLPLWRPPPQTRQLATIISLHSFLQAIQLTFTFAVTFAFVFSPAVTAWVQAPANAWAFWTAWALQLAIMLALICFRENARRAPQNYLLLAAFTVCETYLVGIISSFYSTNSVLVAFGICIGIVLVLTAFAWQTKYDFTAYLGCAVVAVWSLLLFGILAAIWRSQVLNILYGAIGALIFGCFIVIDTQMMLGGKHQLTFSADDYVFAALNLYLDIVQLFLMLLRIFGNRRD